MSPAIQISGLRHTFGDVVALDGLDLEVTAGTVFGLLGPNGAGKTTLVRILSTLLRPTAGHASVLGFDIAAEPLAVRRRIGLAGQFAALDEELTGRENVEMIGRLYRLDAREARRRAAELLERLGLSEEADRRVSTYSGGMRRRLDLGATLIAQPPVILLDEPSTGLDPRSRLRALGPRRRAAPRRHHRPAHHPVPRRGRPPRAADRRARPRPHRRRGHGGRAQGRRRERGALRARRRPHAHRTGRDRAGGPRRR